MNPAGPSPAARYWVHLFTSRPKPVLQPPGPLAYAAQAAVALPDRPQNRVEASSALAISRVCCRRINAEEAFGTIRARKGGIGTLSYAPKGKQRRLCGSGRRGK